MAQVKGEIIYLPLMLLFFFPPRGECPAGGSVSFQGVVLRGHILGGVLPNGPVSRKKFIYLICKEKGLLISLISVLATGRRKKDEGRRELLAFD